MSSQLIKQSTKYMYIVVSNIPPTFVTNFLIQGLLAVKSTIDFPGTRTVAMPTQ